ncbi:hypothetical protein [Thermodesulfatator atlanticus]|uniref:hypothetical protein n=1 Tax=Thermodesulfatator atlanticus TaxID=501497 RepID=UPI0012FBB563|nr:hypothetical protein [Thermodesulfatator atlanticus]
MIEASGVPFKLNWAKSLGGIYFLRKLWNSFGLKEFFEKKLKERCFEIVDLIFFDTTSVYFETEAEDSLRKRGVVELEYRREEQKKKVYRWTEIEPPGQRDFQEVRNKPSTGLRV